mgnify:FL=1
MTDDAEFGDRFAGSKLEGVSLTDTRARDIVHDAVKTHPAWSRAQIKAEVKRRLAGGNGKAYAGL